jgi:hypothetical protein
LNIRICNTQSRGLLLCVLILGHSGTILSQRRAEKFVEIDRILKIDLEKSLRDIFFNHYHNSKHRPSKIDSISLQIQKQNLSRPYGSKEDYVILADLEAGWKEETTIILGFIYTDSKYAQRFKWQGWNAGYGVRPKFVDIDSDSVQEILIIEDDSGNNSMHQYMRIWKYIDKQFREVFKQHLAEGGGSFPYIYKNHYSFRQNPHDPKLQDIQFTVDAGTDLFMESDQTEYQAALKEYGVGMPKHVRQEVVFSFNGAAYVPNKTVYDYRKPIRQFLHEPR